MKQGARSSRGSTLVDYAILVALVACVSVIADAALAHGLAVFLSKVLRPINQALASAAVVR